MRSRSASVERAPERALAEELAVPHLELTARLAREHNDGNCRSAARRLIAARPAECPLSPAHRAARPLRRMLLRHVAGLLRSRRPERPAAIDRLRSPVGTTELT